MLKGLVHFAKDARQAEILRALSVQPLSPERLMVILSARDNPQFDNDNSLAIAEFILDFGEFLES